jgi:hypothetical protein
MDLLPFSHLLGVSLLRHGAPVFSEVGQSTKRPQVVANIRRKYQGACRV